jgi:hypothetical protein
MASFSEEVFCSVSGHPSHATAKATSGHLADLAPRLVGLLSVNQLPTLFSA